MQVKCLTDVLSLWPHLGGILCESPQVDLKLGQELSEPWRKHDLTERTQKAVGGRVEMPPSGPEPHCDHWIEASLGPGPCSRPYFVCAENLQGISGDQL